MRALLVGGSGMLGTNVVVASEGWDLFSTYMQHPLVHPQARQLDMTDADAVRRTVDDLDPDVILHMAGMTKPLVCEQDPALAQRVNVDGTRHIAQAARARDARLIYLSTDLVFGDSDDWRAEEDAPDPISVYGRTKADAEMVVANICDDYAIVRISVLYGWSGRYTASFGEWVLGHLRQGTAAALYTDQWRHLTYIPDLVQVLWELAERVEPLNGIIHAVGPEPWTRYDFGQALARVWGLDGDALDRGSVADSPSAAIAPPRVFMSTAKMGQLLERSVRPIPQGLQDMRALAGSCYTRQLAALTAAGPA